MLPPCARFKALALGLALTVTVGCGDGSATETGAATFDESSCETSYAARVSRTGERDLARLSYACAGELCDPAESFAAGANVDVSIDVPTNGAGVMTIASSDDSVVEAMNINASYDECLGTTRASLTLRARGPGEATLLIESGGVRDELTIRVARADTIDLQVSPLTQLAYEKAREAETPTGQPLLVIPTLLSAEGKHLVGLLALSWSVDDESLAQVRQSPGSEDERFLRDLSDASAVFVDAKQPGVTQLHVTTKDGAKGQLTVRITEPQ